MSSQDNNIDDLLGIEEKPKLEVVKTRKRHKKISLNRTLKRKAGYRPAEESDMRYFYAGYRKGAFPMIDDGLKPQEFTTAFYSILGSMPNADLLTIFNDAGTIIGLCVVTHFGQRIEPHATWMPWAEKSAILATLIKFYHAYSQEYTVLVPVKKETRQCYDHIKRYGIMRYVGMVRDFFDDNEDGFLYQGVKV